MKRIYSILAITFLTAHIAFAQNKTETYLEKSWKEIATRMPAEWYGSDDAKLVAENVLLSQKEIGGWEKNKAWHHKFSEAEKAYYINNKSEIGATFDNSASITELRFLAKVYSQIMDERYKQAFDKGIECILKTQIIVDNKPTVWCAQHDKITLAPAKARSYELPSFSGSESVGITILLIKN